VLATYDALIELEIVMSTFPTDTAKRRTGHGVGAVTVKTRDFYRNENRFFADKTIIHKKDVL
jgi:hypothetical protein